MSIEVRQTSAGRRFRVRWRDPDGRQRVKSFTARRDAELFEADLTRRKRLRSLAQLDAGKRTLDDFVVQRWAPEHGATLQAATRQAYASFYRAHIAATSGAMPLRDITRRR